MLWQDFIFPAGSVIFWISLYHAIRKRDAPPVWTSGPTALVLYVFAVTYATLDLWLSATFSVVTALLWTWLLIMRLREG